MHSPWPESPISDLCSKVIDYRGKTPPKVSEGVKLITAKVIKDGRVLTNAKHEYVPENLYDKIMKRGVPQFHDILITTEAPLGEVAMIRTQEKIALAQRVILLRPDTNVIEPEFLYYMLRSSFIQSRIFSRATGTTVLGIKNPELQSVMIPTPNLALQREVANTLSAYDDLIENNLKRIKLLEELAQITYEEWFVHCRHPSFIANDNHRNIHSIGWEEKPLGDITSLLNRGISPKYVENDGIPVVNQKCIRNHYVDLSLARQTSKDKKISKNKLVKQYDILVNSTGTGTLGRVAQYFDASAFELTVDSHVTIVRASTEISPFYLGRYLERIEPFIESLGKGSTNQIELSSTDMAKVIKVPIPPVQLQDKYEVLAKDIFSEINNLRHQNTLLREARDILLPRLMTGIIDPEEYHPEKVLEEAAV